MITNSFSTHKGNVCLQFEHPLSKDAILERQRKRYANELKMVSDVTNAEESTTHSEPTVKYKLFGNHDFDHYGKHQLISAVNPLTINEAEGTGWDLKIDNTYHFDNYFVVYLNMYKCD